RVDQPEFFCPEQRETHLHAARCDARSDQATVNRTRRRRRCLALGETDRVVAANEPRISEIDRLQESAFGVVAISAEMQGANGERHRSEEKVLAPVGECGGEAQIAGDLAIDVGNDRLATVVDELLSVSDGLIDVRNVRDVGTPIEAMLLIEIEDFAADLIADAQSAVAAAAAFDGESDVVLSEDVGEVG